MADRDPLLLVVGELLVEIMREERDRPLDRPARFVGPFPSGAPAIAASAAARLGARTAFVGRIGDDAFGSMLLERLRRDGIDASRCTRTPGYPTGTAFVAYDAAGDRDFVFNVARSAAGQVSVADLADLPERAAWLHVSGSAVTLGGGLADAVVEAAERVLRAGGRLSLDPNVRGAVEAAARQRLRHLASMAAVVFPSEGELAALGLTEDELTAAGAILCATRGAAGVRVVTADGETNVPAPAASEIDPTGAGDTFAGAYLAASLAGRDPLASAQVAVRAAARAVEAMGPMEADLTGLSL